MSTFVLRTFSVEDHIMMSAELKVKRVLCVSECAECSRSRGDQGCWSHAHALSRSLYKLLQDINNNSSNTGSAASGRGAAKPPPVWSRNFCCSFEDNLDIADCVRHCIVYIIIFYLAIFETFSEGFLETICILIDFF